MLLIFAKTGFHYLHTNTYLFTSFDVKIANFCFRTSGTIHKTSWIFKKVISRWLVSFCFDFCKKF